MATTTKAKPEKRAKQEQIIRVCCGIGCVANGAHDVVKAFDEAIEERGLDNFKIEPHIKTTGCNGLCERGVLVTILPEGGTVLSDDAARQAQGRQRHPRQRPDGREGQAPHLPSGR